VKRIAILGFALLLLARVGSAQGEFIRGDVNADTKVDISDPISIIMFLFRSGGEPVCLDSADANDDGTVNLADPVTILVYLFQGSSPPPEPFPTPGPDPTPDPVCCGPVCNPDLTGIWSGTFYDDTYGEYTVFFEVEDTPDGSMIVTGLESLGNQIYGGEVFIWNGTEDRRLGFDYLTSFDVVEGDFTLSPDGTRMENGEFLTTSGTTGTFSMVRLTALGGPPPVGPGDYKVVFVDYADTAAWGGWLLLEPDGCVAAGSLATVPLVPCESIIEPSLEPPDSDWGVYTGVLKDENGYEANLLGLLGADTGYVCGVFNDNGGTNGFFLLAPADAP
jgi:hypothetical protein